jgi:hypothetical protein
MDKYDILQYFQVKATMVSMRLQNFLCALRITNTNYGLVPSELGIGHYYGHMVDCDEVGYCCGKHEIIFFFC